MPDTLSPLEAAAIIEKRMKRYHPNDAITAASGIAVDSLRAIAAGEYKQVVHARWIHKDCEGIPTENHESISYAECSNCGHEIYNVDWEAERCPSCGARMGKDDSHAPR